MRGGDSGAVLLLAAGLATRLGSLRERHAKACVPIDGVHPLGFLLLALQEAGVDRFLVNLHHRAEQVEREARRFRRDGVRLEFLREEHLLGTGGTVLAAQECLGAAPVLVLNAKFFTDLDWATTLADRAGTVVLHPPGDLGVFGGFAHADGQVLGLRTASVATQGSDEERAVYTGIARPHPAWLEAIARAAPREDGTRCLVRDGLLPSLDDGVPCHVRLHTGVWHEISTPERVEAAGPVLARLRALGHAAAQRPSDPASSPS